MVLRSLSARVREKRSEKMDDIRGIQRCHRARPCIGRRRVWWLQYVNRLVDRSASPLIPGFDGRFLLHGHSAGGQFAARYLVTHPSRLRGVILSAPSTYPFPDPTVVWPNGMGATKRDAQSGGRAGKGIERHGNAPSVTRATGQHKARSCEGVSSGHDKPGRSQRKDAHGAPASVLSNK